ncbi:MAG: hypothetical protein FWD47_01660 [Treponema sp.]|nr:hypothetical protein [Treponema sp.]
MQLITSKIFKLLVLFYIEMNNESVYSESTVFAFKKTIFSPFLRPAFYKVMYSIFYNFFFRQHVSAFLPGRIPVTEVDHPLDEKIPFRPSWIKIYIDFTQFWIRMISFFIRHYKRKALVPIKDFILSMSDLYAFAAKVYTKNCSTTDRPFYIGRFRFFVIHLLDPHLYCIPSLHVMVVIHTYLQFTVIAKKLGEEKKLKEQLAEMKQGAAAITNAILFVKQHSVNCIPAALYAMTRFNPEFFPPKEAEKFACMLLSSAPKTKDEKKIKNPVHPCSAPDIEITDSDQTLIKAHILQLYYDFYEDGKIAKNWYDPLMEFLKSCDDENNNIHN